MGTKKRECLFRLYGYVKKRANECWLSIFNGVHIHKMESKLEGHLLASRLTDKDKKIVVDLTKSLVKSEHILMNLKGKQKDNSMNFRYFHLVLFFVHKKKKHLLGLSISQFNNQFIRKQPRNISDQPHSVTSET
jgi:hypothetical protein